MDFFDQLELSIFDSVRFSYICHGVVFSIKKFSIIGFLGAFIRVWGFNYRFIEYCEIDEISFVNFIKLLGFSLVISYLEISSFLV